MNTLEIFFGAAIACNYPCVLDKKTACVYEINSVQASDNHIIFKKEIVLNNVIFFIK